MYSMKKRLLTFLFGCIPARIGLVLIGKYIPIYYLPFFALFTLSIAIGFLFLYFTGKRSTGLETQGGPIWWMNYRIFHGLFYLIFSILAIMRIRSAYLFLLLDTIFGLLLFLAHHYNEGDLKYLFK
jgi:hypothetical protein